MVNLENPWTYENSSNPWLMDTKKLPKDIIYNYDNTPLTAKNLWKMNSIERIGALNYVFEYLRQEGFPYPKYSQDEIKKELDKIKNLDTNKIIREDGYISNSVNTGLNICQLICKEEYHSAKGDKGTKSLMEIFKDDEALIKVLKNRMGWNTTKEDGTERPYMFPITKSQIRNGIRNSGLGYAVSNFRPSIAKFIYDRYLKPSDTIYDYDKQVYQTQTRPVVFDYSCGWGARALAAQGYKYYGTDPLTADKINQFFIEYNPEQIVKCYKQGSEILIPELINSVDMCMSCPPYFTLERYSEDDTQCYNKYDEYESWLEAYWKPTVNNCYTYLKNNGYFVLVIKDSFGKYNLLNDMTEIIRQYGLSLIKEYQIFNSKNHLSGKKKSGNTTKQNEYILVYQKL